MREINREVLGDEPFPIKAIGTNTPQFEAAIRSLLSEYLPDASFDKLVTNVSNKGHYTSYTITIQPNDHDKIPKIYEALQSLEEIRFVL